MEEQTSNGQGGSEGAQSSFQATGWAFLGSGALAKEAGAGGRLWAELECACVSAYKAGAGRMKDDERLKEV